MNIDWHTIRLSGSLDFISAVAEEMGLSRLKLISARAPGPRAVAKATSRSGTGEQETLRGKLADNENMSALCGKMRSKRLLRLRNALVEYISEQ